GRWQCRPPGSATGGTADHDRSGVSARYRLYEAGSGWVVLATPTEKVWLGPALRVVGYTVQFEVGPGRLHRQHSPLLGEHNRRILEDLLGLASEELQELHDQGINRQSRLRYRFLT